MKHDFAARLVAWHRRHGRHDLPWQNTRDAYRVWLSEIMLQQTQVATVMPYYARFLQRFPTLADLAAAPVEEVMALWSGLGYYARARNLHACAQTVMREHGGAFPRSPEALAALPGIGRSTANSIATFCFGASAPILDGNAKRLLCRAFGVEGFPGSGAVEKRLWLLAEELMPPRDGDIYNQAQMDIGATLCRRSRPRCGECPVAEVCVARGSDRIGELPAARPRRSVPEREATLLVIVDTEARVLLETRPASGIWGGLQSLPELPATAAPADYLATLGFCGEVAAELPPLSHAFSHFRLRIQPLLCRVATAPQAADGQRQWLDLAAALAAALPAPVRRVLAAQSFFQAVSSSAAGTGRP